MDPATAAALVFTEADLVRRITAFQRGLPLPLYDLWRARKPRGVLARLTPSTGCTVAKTFVQYGTLALLETAKRVAYSHCRSRGWGFNSKPPEAENYVVETLSLVPVADLAFELNRVDILAWALATKTSSLTMKTSS